MMFEIYGKAVAKVLSFIKGEDCNFSVIDEMFYWPKVIYKQILESESVFTNHSQEHSLSFSPKWNVPRILTG